MIVFSHNHYYIYIRQRKWTTRGENGKNRWVLFNDEQVYAMSEGWSEILNDCLSSKAYPSVLVYESVDATVADDVEVDDPVITQQQVDDWLTQAEEQDEDLFTQENIDEQIRLFKLHEQKLNQTGDGDTQGAEEYHGEGFYKLFYIQGKQKQVNMNCYNSKNEVTNAYGKYTTSKAMTAGFEIVSIKAASKRAKTELSKLKNFINAEK